MRFRQFLENTEQIRTAIQSLLMKSQQLPDTDKDEDLWGEKNNKRNLVSFYQDVLHGLDDELARRLSSIPLDGDPHQVFKIINSGGHPVRDYLILKANGLH